MLNKKSALYNVLIKEELRAERVIAIFRALFLGLALVGNVIQAAVSHISFKYEVIPVAIAFGIALFLLVDVMTFSRFKKLKKLFSNINKYFIIILDAVTVTCMIYVIGKNFYSGVYESFNVPIKIDILPVFAMILTVIYLVMDIFRFSTFSTYWTAGWFAAGYFILSAGIFKVPSTEEVFWISSYIYGGTVIIIAVLCAAISAKVKQILVKSKKQEQLERFLPQNMASYYLEKGQDLSTSGKRQKVTILFSDIMGFTSMSEKQEPEETVDFLNSYFNDMIEVIFKHNGILDKFIGDGFMALFGAPDPSENDSENAVKAAIEMSHKLIKFNALREFQGKQPIRIGIGIHTGEVVIGQIGTNRRMDYTAIGDAVNTSSRLEHATRELQSEIIISDKVKQDIQGFYNTTDLGEFHVRGKESKVHIFSVEPGLAEEHQPPETEGTSTT